MNHPTKLLPLTHSYVKNSVSILMESRTENKLSIPQVIEVFSHLQKLHPLLNVRIVKRNTSYFFEQDPDLKISIQATREDSSSCISNWMNQPLDLNNLLEVKIIQNPKGDTLATKIHHGISDGVSCFELHNEFFIQLERLIKGKKFTKEAYPFPPFIESLVPPDIQQMDKKKIAQDFLKNPTNKPILNLDADFKNKEKKQICRLEHAFSKEETQSLIDTSHKKGFSINSILGAALLETTQHFIKTSQDSFYLSIDIPVDLRPLVDPPLPSRCLASIVGGFHPYILISKSGDFWKVVEDLQKKSRKENHLDKIFKAAHAYDEIFNENPEQEEKVELYTSNLGYVKYSNHSFKIREFGFHACCEVPFLVTFSTLNQQLRCFFLYTTPLLSHDFIKAYTSLFASILKQI
ncbi:MAG: hypothetical protein S4CHLAM7_03160 [Chlamydiae bacterium]|nr:hypothetical protein [Chlamydiota bacterium]